MKQLFHVLALCSLMLCTASGQAAPDTHDQSAQKESVFKMQDAVVQPMCFEITAQYSMPEVTVLTPVVYEAPTVSIIDYAFAGIKPECISYQMLSRGKLPEKSKDYSYTICTLNKPKYFVKNSSLPDVPDVSGWTFLKQKSNC